MHTAEITFHRGGEREFTWYEDCATLQAAVDYIERNAAGSTGVRVFINNVRVEMTNGKVRLNDELRAVIERAAIGLVDDVGSLGDRVEYHQFLNDRRNPPLSYGTWKAQRPVPTNPATLIATGKLEA